MALRSCPDWDQEKMNRVTLAKLIATTSVFCLFFGSPSHSTPNRLEGVLGELQYFPVAILSFDSTATTRAEEAARSLGNGFFVFDVAFTPRKYFLVSNRHVLLARDSMLICYYTNNHEPTCKVLHVKQGENLIAFQKRSTGLDTDVAICQVEYIDIAYAIASSLIIPMRDIDEKMEIKVLRTSFFEENSGTLDTLAKIKIGHAKLMIYVDTLNNADLQPFFVMDFKARHGHSGSPILEYVEGRSLGETRLLGVSCAHAGKGAFEGDAWAMPGYRVLELLKRFRNSKVEKSKRKL